ncbi:hypothetical protein [Patiriisocius sp. Uisw_017]|uniref:hypothetical protein n=1 Tax=Patiriisocius sp. Uisw_017 TaxID=3230968 RepID=UPI0039EC23EF
MEKYIIKLSVFESDKTGKRTSNSYEKEFQEVTPFKSRIKAVKEIKRITTLMEGDSLGKKNENNKLHFFLIDLVFSTKKGVEYKIFGEQNLILPSLAKEANYYKRKKKAKLIKALGTDGKQVEVLESDFDFFLL